MGGSNFYKVVRNIDGVLVSSGLRWHYTMLRILNDIVDDIPASPFAREYEVGEIVCPPRKFPHALLCGFEKFADAKEYAETVSFGKNDMVFEIYRATTSQIKKEWNWPNFQYCRSTADDLLVQFWSGKEMPARLPPYGTIFCHDIMLDKIVWASNREIEMEAPW